jgi:CheY-like chemotaxis protein
MQLSPVIKEMHKIMKETFPRNIEAQVDLAPDLWLVQGDATQMHQIVLNLCVNARDAMPDGGRIHIAAANVELTEAEAARHQNAKPIPYVRLSVADTGTGMTPQVMQKIFEPFFTTKEVGKGTGLGLSTVMSIVKNHGGFLELTSEVGKGTTFHIHIPAAANATTTASKPVPLEELHGLGETVLIVDDEPTIVGMLEAILQAFGYRALVATNGAEAIELAAQHRGRIDVAMVDLMMPVLDGRKTIAALRERHPAIRLIAISGLLQDEVAKEQLVRQGVRILPKPLTTERLLHTLREVGLN